MLPHDHGLDRVSFLTINRNGIKERAEPTAVIAKVLNVHNVNGDERGKVHGAWVTVYERGRELLVGEEMELICDQKVV